MPIKKKMTQRNKREKGLALITVMMVVAMVSATASWLMLQQHVALRRVTNVVHEEQALLLALGAESYVRGLLTSDARSGGNRSVDYYARYDDPSRNEWWSRQGAFDEDRMSYLYGFEDVRRSDITWCVFDLSAFHNINNFRFLATGKKSVDQKKTEKPKSVREKSEEARGDKDKKDEKKQELQTDPTDTKTRTMSELEWEQAMFNSLYGGSSARWSALMDWFDKDDRARFDGGEDPHYLNLNVPYRTSGMRMVWPEELGIVKGFDGFRPSKEIVALPSVKPTKINVNTASREMLGKIISHMRVTLSGEEWSEMLYQRRYNPFRRLDDFYGRLVSYNDERITKASLAWANKFLSVSSNYFLALIQIRLGNSSFYLQSVIVRDPEDPYDSYVLQRRLGKVGHKRRDCRIDSPIIVQDEKDQEES